MVNGHFTIRMFLVALVPDGGAALLDVVPEGGRLVLLHLIPLLVQHHHGGVQLLVVLVLRVSLHRPPHRRPRSKKVGEYEKGR